MPYLHASPGILWFRVFGVGLSFQDASVEPLLFSQRNRFSKMLRIGDFVVTYLPR